MGRLVLQVVQTPARPTSVLMEELLIQRKLACGGQPSAPAMTHLKGGPGTSEVTSEVFPVFDVPSSHIHVP